MGKERLCISGQIKGTLNKLQGLSNLLRLREHVLSIREHIKGSSVREHGIVERTRA